MSIDVSNSDPVVPCDKERVDAHGPGLKVSDVMVASPKTVPAQASVAQLRELFANPHVRMALLVDGERFVGMVRRGEIPEDASDQTPARELARRDLVTVAPDAPVSEAMAILDREGEHRLVVLDPDGQTLRGLVCLTRDRAGFCQS